LPGLRQSGPSIGAQQRRPVISFGFGNSISSNKVGEAAFRHLTAIRADVAGHMADRVSFGPSGIVDERETVLRAAAALRGDIPVAEVDAGM
jgi:hypothetical protein